MGIKQYYLPLFLVLISLVSCSVVDNKSVITTRDLAYTAYIDKDYATAVEQFEKLVLDIPKDAELWFKLGNAYAKNKQPQQAISAYQNSLLRDPRFEKAWYNMGIVQTQIALKTFIDMSEYVDKYGVVAERSEKIRDGLLFLLDIEGE